MTKKILIAVLFFLIVSQIAAAQTTYQADTTISISDGQPYQISLNVSNATGTNNATTVYCNGHCNANFSDVYFQMSSTNLSYWIENTTSPAKFWINVTSNGTVSMLYGGNAANASNGTSTFLQYNGSQTSSSIAPLVVNVTDRAFEAKVRATSASHNLRWGMSNSLSVNDDYMFLQSTTGTNVVQFEVANENVATAKNAAPAFTSNTSYKLKLINTTGGITAYINDAQYLTTTNTNLPNELLGLFFLISSGTGAQEYSFARRYISPEPQWATWGAEQAIVYIPIVASETIQYSVSESTTVNTLIPSKHRSINITENYNGTWTIQFRLFQEFSGAAYTVFGQIYRNDIPYGTLQSTSNQGWTIYNETLIASNTVSGDEYSIYAYKDPASQTAYIDDYYIRFDYDYANATPILTYPTNGSTLSFNFPPQTSDINFTWSQIGSSGYQIQIAEDAAFSLIEVDTTTTNNYSVQAMDSGTHYWRVRTYNDAGATLGNWSSTFSFLFTEVAPSISGAAINGVVYFLSNGAPTPLQGATVFLYNSSFTQQITTGSNGYFLFQNLENHSIYFIKASIKDYQTSEIITVNVSGVMTYNIQMKPVEPTFFENDKQYVLFTARYMFCWSDCDVEGATMTVYKSGEATPVQIGAESNPKTTDTTGSASFLLFKTQQYRITLVNASAGVNSEMALYPKDTEYLWLITRSNDAFQDHDILEKDAIITTVSKSVINSTAAYINVTFNDTQAQTTNMTVFLNQTNSSISTWTANGNGTNSFLVTNYQGKSYLIHFYGTAHPEYDTIDYTYSVLFEKTDVGISGIPGALWLWFAVGIMFFTAAIFTASTVELGLIIVCAEGWIFLALGMFGSLGTTGTTRFGIALSLISVLAIMAYAKRQQTKEGYV